MISYNPKDWFTFIFKFHNSDTFKKLALVMLGIAIYSAIITYFIKDYYNLPENHFLKNITIMHTMLGFVISLLLVFRTNTAYDRWWEGRKQWGELVNNSRNLGLKISSILKDKEDILFFRKIIPYYAHILDLHLKNHSVTEELFEEFDLELEQKKHRPNQVAKLLFKKISDLQQNSKITPEQLLYINHEVSSFTNVCGACERIKNTPIPFSYDTFIKKFIFFYTMTLPFGYIFYLGYYSVPIVVFIFYILASLELIADEIEDPFGTDENDLPTQKIVENIKKNIEEILILP